MSGTLPDIVVPVRQDPVNAQLRYALRSWSENLPHRRVWVVGYRPPWLTGEVGFLPVPQTGTKYANTTAAVRTACEHPEVTGEFLLCNDDFFAMRPVERMPVLHRGPVREVAADYGRRGHNGRYVRGMQETAALLEGLGFDDPLSYELHVPLPVRKEGMLYALEVGARLDVLHKRTAYGVLNRIGGDRIDDVKILTRFGRFPRDSPWLSTMPDSFAAGEVGRLIRAAFPRPSRYERHRGR